MAVLAPYAKAESQLGDVHSETDVAGMNWMFVIGILTNKPDSAYIDCARMSFDSREYGRAEMLQDVALGK